MREDKEIRISVVGLGYVGMPLAVELSEHFHVVGYDTCCERIEAIAASAQGVDIELSADDVCLANCTFHIIAVPTPTDDHNRPDLTCLYNAAQTVGRYLKVGDVVVVESSVYPGCTEEEVAPLIEKASGLKAGADFGLGYSPERINPGDKQHTLRNVVKVIAAQDKRTLDAMRRVYGTVVDAGLFEAESIRVAEAAKILENTQRDVNIALMNEMSAICQRLGISTHDVLRAAQTKWNFVSYEPGLVGGHCIGIDPYYLLHKADEVEYDARLVRAARAINESMGVSIAQRIAQKLTEQGLVLSESRVLVLGATYKPNVGDVRNTRSADMVGELKRLGLGATLIDPHASATSMMSHYGIKIDTEPTGLYDAVVLAVPHDEFVTQGFAHYQQYLTSGATVCDIKGAWRGQVSGHDYWTL